MKRLLITTDCFLPRWDGVTRFLTELIPELKKEFNVKILCPDFGKIPPEYKFKKIQTYNMFFGDIKFAKLEKKTIYNEIRKADLVFNQSLGPIGMLSILGAKKYKKKIITYTHVLEWELTEKAMRLRVLGRIIKFFMKRISRFFYSKTDLMILPSKSFADVLEWHKFGTEKIVSNLGVDNKKFIPPKNKEIIKKNLGLENKLVIGYHGRLAREKNLITLLRAFRRLNDDNSRLLIVGDGLREIKNKLNKKNVVLVGSKENVIPYLQAMDIYVMPSLTETSCLSVMEAMSCSLPVISTPVGFVRDYIKHNKNGLFFNFQNSFELYKNLLKLKNYELRNKLGMSARRTIIEKFNIDDANKKIVKILKHY